MQRMPYREPAVDEDAQADAAEIATFAARLEQGRARVLGLVLGSGLLAVLGLGGVVGLIYMQRPVSNGREGCHIVFSIDVDHGATRRTEQLVCPNTAPSIVSHPWPSPT